MANIPGLNGALPGVYTDIQTQSRGASVPGGIRVSAIIGEGSRTETLISAALGNGLDGWNSTYTVEGSNTDGRHFKTSLFPLISNRTTLYRNGIPLVGLEEAVDSSSFSSKYDYRIDPETGQIETQTAYLVDQGGSFYVPFTTNKGIGTVSNLTLLDVNAPTETWSIRCVDVQRNPLNNPIDDTAKFVAVGSVSGNKLDANGNPVVWIANGQTFNNGIIEFSISETKNAGVSVSPFRQGDGFTVKVKSGVLVKNDTLVANYVAVEDINDPQFLENMISVSIKHGNASLDNNLTLGCQLAFANAAPGIMCLQAAPSMPRRTSFLLVDSFDANSTDNDDFIFPLPLGVAPDLTSNIHFFVKNNTTNVETQTLPNKLPFYSLGTSGNPTESQFIYDDTPAPGGYSFYYTVIQQASAQASGLDGYIGRNLAFNNIGVFSSPSIQFDSSYVGKTLKVLDATNAANNTSYTIDTVSNGSLGVTGPTTFPDFTSETTLAFEVINVSTNTPVLGGSATDGVLTALIATDTATLSSATVDFGSLPSLLSRRLKINASATNNGLYDIVAYDSMTDTLTLKKAIVNESDLRFEVIDPAELSQYVVVNKNTVPNGYSLRVTLVDSKDASFYDAGWINALEALEIVECDILVPLPKQTKSIIFQNSLIHCQTMSSIKNKKERVLFMGAINGLEPDNLTGAKPAAVEDIGILEGIQGDSVTEVLSGNIEDLTNYSVPDAFGGTYRCVYFYPDQIVVQAGSDNSIVDGFYIAAAAGGYMSGNARIEMPLTNKILAGFTILRNKQFSPRVLENLANAGVCTLQPVQGGGKVVWGLTTSQSGFIEEREISIIFIRDRIAKALRGGFDGFIGLAQDTNLIAKMSARAIALLNGFVNQNIISEYRDLNIEEDATDPTQINITCAVRPTYPVNFIYIKVDIGNL